MGTKVDSWYHNYALAILTDFIPTNPINTMYKRPYIYLRLTTM